jgi:epoxide hydrolase-like predicted phosphatase
MSKIKAIVFDYDGVIELRDKSLGPLSVVFREMLGVSREEWGDVYHKHNHLSNIENMPWFEMITRVVCKLGATDSQVEEMRALSEENNKTTRLNTELLEYIVKDLKPKGYLIGMLSNNTSDLRDRLAMQEIDGIFDQIIISAEEGYQKPHEPIFEALFRKLGVRPEEVVFTDDNTKPLEKAEIIGYVPILFKNTEQFIEELDKVLKK